MSRTAQQATVYVVDQGPSELRALGRLLKASGLHIESFPSTTAFLEQHDAEAPGCVLLDVTPSGLTGVEVQSLFQLAGNRLPVIFLTGDGNLSLGVQAMKGGAVDNLSKPCSRDVLLEAIGRALALDAEARRKRAVTGRARELVARLTPREREVMVKVVAGYSNKRIGAALGIVDKTVKVHRGRVMTKLGVTSVADLVRLSDRAAMDS